MSDWDRVITVHFGCDGIERPVMKLYVEYELGKPAAGVPDDTIFLSAKWRPGERVNFSLYRHLPFPTNGTEARVALKEQFAPDVGALSLAFTDRVLSELIAPRSRVDLMPYGGSKDSGLGREGPRYAIHEMSELRTVTLTG